MTLSEMLAIVLILEILYLVVLAIDTDNTVYYTIKIALFWRRWL